MDLPYSGLTSLNCLEIKKGRSLLVDMVLCRTVGTQERGSSDLPFFTLYFGKQFLKLLFII